MGVAVTVTVTGLKDVTNLSGATPKAKNVRKRTERKNYIGAKIEELDLCTLSLMFRMTTPSTFVKMSFEFRKLPRKDSFS